MRHLEDLGVGEGWVCWEVGGGGGSIAAWLARRVGSSGRVLVTDMDPQHLVALDSLGLTILQVQRHEVVGDPLSLESFDLIHARLVLMHLRTADQVLIQLETTLKPGGCLFIEDYDLRFADRVFPAADPATAAVFKKAWDAVQQVVEDHGYGTGWGVGSTSAGMSISVAVIDLGISQPTHSALPTD